MTDWIGSTVAQVLARCRAHYSEVQLIDEPPGKLRLLKFTCREDEPKQVVIEVESGSGSFSPNRSWRQSVVERLKVVKVHDADHSLF
jgi:hypothetical protein